MSLLSFGISRLRFRFVWCFMFFRVLLFFVCVLASIILNSRIIFSYFIPYDSSGFHIYNLALHSQIQPFCTVLNSWPFPPSHIYFIHFLFDNIISICPWSIFTILNKMILIWSALIVLCKATINIDSVSHFKYPLRNHNIFASEILSLKLFFFFGFLPSHSISLSFFFPCHQIYCKFWPL